MAKTTTAEPSRLAILNCLTNLCECLDKEGKITITSLKKVYGFTDPELSLAISHGVENKNLNRESYNYISLNKYYITPESEYYASVSFGLTALWKSESYSEEQFYVEETAKRDSKIVGPWTRPDLLIVSHKKFPWTIGVEFDVITFEVKRPDSANVLAVFEALSHSSVATKAYVVFPCGHGEWTESSPEQAQRVKDECARHGVGLILIDISGPDPKPTHLIKAVRREISHERCSNFLEAVVTPEGRAKIAGWK